MAARLWPATPLTPASGVPPVGAWLRTSGRAVGMAGLVLPAWDERRLQCGHFNSLGAGELPGHAGRLDGERRVRGEAGIGGSIMMAAVSSNR